MTENEIKKCIEKYVGYNYSSWTIGVTNDPEKSRREHGDPEHWHQWDASGEEPAKRIAYHFLEKGYNGSGDMVDSANYVYIF